VLAVDTNVLVRILVDEPGASTETAAARKALAAEARVFIPDVALVEAIWVLRASYEFSKEELLGAFVRLLENDSFVWGDWQAVSAALAYYTSYNVDFADCLILAKAEIAGATLATFDRKLARIKGVRRIL
jgi:predicted nucleic-acid-binding protein